MHNPFRPPPAPPAFASGDNTLVPEPNASFFSKLIFSWLDPILSVGFSRPLQKEDLWHLPVERRTDHLSTTVERAFYDRCKPEQRPAFLRDPIPQSAASDSDVASQTVEDEKAAHEHAVQDEQDIEALANSDEKALPEAGPVPAKEPQERGEESENGKKKKYDGSLLMALNATFFWRWWGAGFFYLIASVLNTTSPLVNKLLLTWLEDSYAYIRASVAERASYGLSAPQGIGYGIGISFAIFVMQESSSLMTCHYQLMSLTTGLTIRTSVIGAIFRKSLRLSGRSRGQHSVGQITTMISSDAMRLERVTAFAHILWVAPIQIAIGVGLLIGQLGYSALVGLGVLVLGFPLQLIFVGMMFGQRKKGVVLTDQRVRLITEVLQGIRLIKLYAWEGFYVHQVSRLREREVGHVRKLGMARACLIAIATVMPVLAAVLSFITYALSGHTLSVAVIFTSLQFFNIIRQPLMFLPMVFAASTDAVVALKRISAFLVAEELEETYAIDAESKHAVVVDGDFTWETAQKPSDNKFERGGPGARGGRGGGKGKKPAGGRKGRSEKKGAVLPTTAAGGGDADEKKAEEKPFALEGLNLKIPQGSFVAIVGSIGSGKSSLLQALIGEMRKTRGEVVFSAPMAYVPQAAWIMNATLVENITFGQPLDETKLQDIIAACCLEPDLKMLPNGQETEIGEKGINLSGGQKARVSLARAAYSGADIVLMDDSLSAVDAYVGKTILDKCLLNGPLANKTRVLVTHALHVLDKTDYIYVMDNGAIVEQGHFNDLMSGSVIFSRLMEEYGNLEKEDEVEGGKKGPTSKAVVPDGTDPRKAQDPLMQAEERVTGAVTLNTYVRYFRFAGGVLWIFMLLFWLTLYQGASVFNNIFLGFWTAQSLSGFSQGDYMATYAALGFATGLFSFALSMSLTFSTLIASLSMFKSALRAVLHSPTSFFDTTPMGRIISRLSNDQDTLDTEVSMIAFQLTTSFSSVIGTVALVFYTYPYLGIIFVPMLIFYYGAAVYYRRSSVETKRLDSLMRSALYAAYSETLTGLSTVRAYGEQTRFIKKAEEGLDMENRAYYMTVAIQQWLATRLDVLGNILVLGIALFSAGFRNTVNPSKTGVVLSYTLSITQVFSQLVQTYAQNEQNFNAVERVLFYTRLSAEGETTTPNDPPPSWPEKGQVEFKNVELAYREGLPLVLKGISFTVNPGEKVGIVGRTGAGKSSLLQALFRTVNVQNGSIEIDGWNIGNMGLAALRSRLALVPQDNILFKGKLRENLDPQVTRTDAELISALQRTWLLPRDGSSDPAAEAKFSLDCAVNDEGSNYSAGEKQLLALCRALVKNSRIIVLDEATSNVDVEMDAKLQKTIQTEFVTSTLLCIAHRLNTIVYYDRVIVMDAGQVAEFDTPLNLFDREDSIFRSLCDEAGLARADILRIRAGVETGATIEEVAV